MAQVTESLRSALQNDPRRKAWMSPNKPLFINSREHNDMFLTTYRIRNAYEDLLDKLELNENVSDERDRILIQRYFEMMFYPPRAMSLRQWKEGKEAEVRIVRAYKDTRQKRHGKRQFEISLLLDDGNIVQINPNEVLNKYMTLRRDFLNLENSSL